MVINENKVIIGNLKMNGSLAFYQNYFDTLKSSLKNLKHVTIGICLPYPYLFQAEQVLSGSSIQWGSQNVGKFLSGAHTGEVSASMLRDFSSTYVIVGHSERNTAYCESEENIADKFQMVKEHGMTPVLCVGETLIEREAGIMESVVKSQLEAITKKYSDTVFENSIVAYEPIWAIGTDMAATPEQTNHMCSFIRNTINNKSNKEIKNIKIIYGGSVNPKNTVQLFRLESVDGGLIGRSSLSADDFTSICNLADSLSD
jgi:triosephosphate isomerase (TIM)